MTSSTNRKAETWAPPLIPTTPVDTVRATLLRESGLLNPNLGEINEAHQLAETVIRDVLSEQIGVPELSAGLQESLRDLADLVANDPETATVDQIHEVAAALRSVLDHHFSEHMSPR